MIFKTKLWVFSFSLMLRFVAILRPPVLVRPSSFAAQTHAHAHAHAHTRTHTHTHTHTHTNTHKHTQTHTDTCLLSLAKFILSRFLFDPIMLFDLAAILQMYRKRGLLLKPYFYSVSLFCRKTAA